MPFTPDTALDLLFPEELVPQHIKDELPPELHVRLNPFSSQTPIVPFCLRLTGSGGTPRLPADAPVGFDGL